MKQIAIRLAAAKKGESRYQGGACKRGHDGWRFTSNGVCCQCAADANAAIRSALQAARQKSAA